MHIIICSKEAALAYVPKNAIYGIRIFDSEPDMPGSRQNKKQLHHLVLAHDYVFDDLYPDEWDKHYPGLVSELQGEKVFFNIYIADRIIRDFMERPPCDAMLVHCNAGLARSPAIAIALNEFFSLGQKAMKKQYRSYNRHVYETMRMAWEKI